MRYRNKIYGVLGLVAGCASTSDQSGECVESAFRCVHGEGSAFERCEKGKWVEAGQCDGACDAITQQCAKSACSKELTRCTKEESVERCDPEVGGWLTPTPCDKGEVCAPDEGGCAQVVCAAGQRECDGQEVLECNDTGTALSLVETCDGTCLNGSCDELCNAAAREHAVAGCLAYAVDLNQRDGGQGVSSEDNNNFTIAIVNPHDELSAEVVVERRDDGSWTEVASATVDEGSIATLPSIILLSYPSPCPPVETWLATSSKAAPPAPRTARPALVVPFQRTTPVALRMTLA